MIALVLLVLATPNAPGAIKSALTLSKLPDCTLCHSTLAGGAGTVTTPFGKAIVTAGAIPFDQDSFTQAVKKLETDKTDSDGDGTPDADELKAGTNPNVVGSSDTVKYGCQSVPGLGLFALLVGLSRNHLRPPARVLR